MSQHPASPHTPAARPSAWRRLAGTALGAGWLPVAPGTWGSLVGLAAVAALTGVDGLAGGAGLLARVAPGSEVPARLVVAALAAAASVLGWWLGERAAVDFGGADPGAFVLDEVAGQMLASLPLVAGTAAAPLPLEPAWLLASFALFRVFDVAKPPPCRAAERLPGGVGIMADDMVAGLYAAALVLASRALLAG